LARHGSILVEWSRRFDDPIPLPDGGQLVTLKHAADYIMELPDAEQNLEQWQTAIGCLIGAARPGLRDACAHRGAAGFEPQHGTNLN
jgi:hypothetical protein